ARLIDAAVVHNKDLVGKAESIEVAKESRQQLLQVVSLVENGQNDRNRFKAHREDSNIASHGGFHLFTWHLGGDLSLGSTEMAEASFGKSSLVPQIRAMA